MALKALVDSLDDVAEGIRGEYEEHEGKFRLKVDGADSLVDTKGLKAALEKERTKGKRADAWERAFVGKTPEEIAELVKQAEGGTGDGGKPDVDKLVKKLRGELEQEFAPVRTENETLKGKLRQTLIGDRFRAEALKAGAIPERLDDLTETSLKRLDLNDKDAIIVLDKDGDPSAVSFDKWVAETLKKDKPWAFKAPDASGGDAGDGRAPRNTGTVKSLKDLKSDAEKSAFIKKNGFAAFKALPAQ